MKKFIALWKHRYQKYSHILKVNIHFIIDFLWFKVQKLYHRKPFVAIALTQQFGDIVAGEPLSRQVRKKHPNSTIIWFVRPAFKELVQNNPNIDIIFEDICANHRKKILGANIFDTVYNLQFRNNSHCEICNVFVDNEVADKKGITIENYYFHGNLLEVQQKIAGIELIDETPILYFSNSEVQKIDSLNLPTKFIVIHCQSAQNSRNWDASKWQQLINQLIEQYDIAIVEIGLSSELAIHSKNYINLCGKLSLLETAEVIKRARLYIGIDSGPAHLANAVGTYGIIMLGKLANFVNHIPYSGGYKSGKTATIIRNTNGPSSEIEISEVLEVIKSKELI
ncbi:glycosyl transferase family 9 [Emticicia oligotrophica DSM 17448]|uniref:Glycosyl transferase family 9 n=1 Tax=Emticicia oligotrophica (strain DSM 17448 / CIP 109782 / MTCC 6937 / GPTSA100-15) TaxID=929562 RepID=A0ABM5N6C2_EMTOG|nr:glycosyltransferase family 9 protein [Emticicia oligotrophica]AFK05073.1 glycosyl transferase family 9 [Emticicia oligotrophica DSM 17448]